MKPLGVSIDAEREPEKVDNGSSKSIGIRRVSRPSSGAACFRLNATRPLNQHFGDRQETRLIVPPLH